MIRMSKRDHHNQPHQQASYKDEQLASLCIVEATAVYRRPRIHSLVREHRRGPRKKKLSVYASKFRGPSAKMQEMTR